MSQEDQNKINKEFDNASNKIVLELDEDSAFLLECVYMMGKALWTEFDMSKASTLAGFATNTLDNKKVNVTEVGKRLDAVLGEKLLPLIKKYEAAYPDIDPNVS